MLTGQQKKHTDQHVYLHFRPTFGGSIISHSSGMLCTQIKAYRENNENQKTLNKSKYFDLYGAFVKIKPIY